MVALSKTALEFFLNHPEICGGSRANGSVFLLGVAAFLQNFEQKGESGHAYRCDLTALFQIAVVYAGCDISSYLQEEVCSVNGAILVSTLLLCL